MLKFFKELAIASMSLFLINLIIFYLIINPEFYRPYEKIIENIESNNLIFSDSHGWSLTKKNYLGETKLKKNNIKNLSYGSDSYTDIYIKLGYLIKQGMAIDTVYLSIDPHMLGKKREINNNKNRSILYANFEDYNSVYTITYSEFIFRKYVRKYISTFDVNNANLIQRYFNSFFTSTNVSEKEQKKWIDLSKIERENKSKSKFIDFYSRGSSEKLENILHKILKMAKENNIVVIGLHFPIAQQMKNFKIPESIKLPRNIFLIKKLLVIDLTDIDTDKYFINQDHVNNLGADLIIDRILK
jgi:effector-binding domain-containing protein